MLVFKQLFTFLKRAVPLRKGKSLPCIAAMRLDGDLGDEAAGFRRVRRRRVDDPLRPRPTVDVIDLEIERRKTML